MSNETDYESDPGPPPPTVDVTEQRADGSVHVVISIPTEEDAPPPPPPPPPAGAGSSSGNTGSDAKKFADKVFGGLWKAIKPSGGGGND